MTMVNTVGGALDVITGGRGNRVGLGRTKLFASRFFFKNEKIKHRNHVSTTVQSKTQNERVLTVFFFFLIY